LQDLLRRCLAKNRKERWYAIGDVRVALEASNRDLCQTDRAHNPRRDIT
jgi:hypothetical protein